MMYNQTKVNGAYMPLLMGLTKPETIKSIDSQITNGYEPISQVVIWEASAHDTMCQKVEVTMPGPRQDRKSRKDDKKYY